MKHTPGPWNKDAIYLIFRYGSKQGALDGVEEGRIPDDADWPDYSNKADMNLVAVAPETLEFVEWMSKGYGVPVGMQEKAVALLKKIEDAE